MKYCRKLCVYIHQSTSQYKFPFVYRFSTSNSYIKNFLIKYSLGHKLLEPPNVK